MSRGIYCILNFWRRWNCQNIFCKSELNSCTNNRKWGLDWKGKWTESMYYTPFGLFAANWVCLVSVALLLLVRLGLAFWFSNWWQRRAFCPGYRFTFHSNIERYEKSAFIAQSKLEWKWYFYFCFWEPLRTNGSAVVLPSSCSWLWSNNLYSAAELHEIRTN